MENGYEMCYIKCMKLNREIIIIMSNMNGSGGQSSNCRIVEKIVEYTITIIHTSGSEDDDKIETNKWYLDIPKLLGSISNIEYIRLY